MGKKRFDKRIEIKKERSDMKPYDKSKNNNEKSIQCWKCKETGHTADKCKGKKKEINNVDIDDEPEEVSEMKSETGDENSSIEDQNDDGLMCEDYNENGFDS